MNFVMSYSGGKDGALALHRMMSANHKPVALITTINIEQERSWFHGIEKDILETVAKSIGVPLIACECLPDEYAESFEKGLAKASALGATACVFGDIDIADHRKWNEERCMSAGLECILPLWDEEREKLVIELIESGFKALIKIVQCNKLDDSFLGKDLTIPLMEKIKLTGSDVCGENGEYHTFVHDGPIFRSPIHITTKNVVDFGTHKAIALELYYSSHLSIAKVLQR